MPDDKNPETKVAGFADAPDFVLETFAKQIQAEMDRRKATGRKVATQAQVEKLEIGVTHSTVKLHDTNRAVHDELLGGFHKVIRAHLKRAIRLHPFDLIASVTSLMCEAVKNGERKDASGEERLATRKIVTENLYMRLMDQLKH